MQTPYRYFIDFNVAYPGLNDERHISEIGLYVRASEDQWSRQIVDDCMIRWYDVGCKEPAAKFEIFEDTWQVFKVMPDVFEEFAKLANANPTVDQVKDLLKSLGFVDESIDRRTDPSSDLDDKLRDAVQTVVKGNIHPTLYRRIYEYEITK